jgi:hypothetical protein
MLVSRAYNLPVRWGGAAAISLRVDVREVEGGIKYSLWTPAAPAAGLAAGEHD